MSVQQAEYVAFKKDVAASIGKLEEVVTKTNFDAAAAATVIAELQNSYSAISVQAAPWSAAIQAEVAASESKASAAFADVKRLYEITKTEVEELRRRATEVEKPSPHDKKGMWELSRPKDIEREEHSSNGEKHDKRNRLPARERNGHPAAHSDEGLDFGEKAAKSERRLKSRSTPITTMTA